MAGFDANVADGLNAAYQHFKALERGHHPPSAAFWAAMADMMAQTLMTYLDATLPPYPPPGGGGDGPSVGPRPGDDEMRRREREERRRKIIEMWEEFDRDKERHLVE